MYEMTHTSENNQPRQNKNEISTEEKIGSQGIATESRDHASRTSIIIYQGNKN